MDPDVYYEVAEEHALRRIRELRARCARGVKELDDFLKAWS